LVIWWLTGKLAYFERNSHTVTLPSINQTGTALKLNPHLKGKMQPSNHLTPDTCLCDERIYCSHRRFFFVQFFKFVSFVQTKQLFSSLPTWQARLKQCTDLLKDVTVFPAEQLAQAAESFYFKLAAADQYQPMGRFSGTISLVRAKDNYMNLGADYGLAQVGDEWTR